MEELAGVAVGSGSEAGSRLGSGLGSGLSAGSGLFVFVDEQERVRAERRRIASAAAALGASVLWYLMLERLHVAAEAMPWYVTSAAIAVACACVAMQGRGSGGQLVLVLRGGASAARRPLSLLETWAATYFLCALALYLWVVAHGAVAKIVPPRMVQVVDIQLESAKDFANRESPMPGTEEQPQMHQRKSDDRTVQGDFAKVKTASRAKVDVTPVKVQPTPVVVRQPLVTPVRPIPSPPVVPLPTAPKKMQKQPFVMEEIQPPEMVEMIENDGEADAPVVFQSGGSSAGGKGAANELSTYIKELHKRIKAAWAPPRGQTRAARILFRIKRDGGLAFERVQQSSGDAETDEAALRAVTLAVKKLKALPDDYALPFLDVEYTFKYTADELKEVDTFIHSIE